MRVLFATCTCPVKGANREFFISPHLWGPFFCVARGLPYCALAVLYPRGPAYKAHHVGALMRALLQHVCDKAPYAKALPYYGSLMVSLKLRTISL